MKSISGKDLAITIAQAMENRKAEDITILKMPDIMVETDYFVIGTCSSSVQMQAVYRFVIDELNQLGLSPIGQEGRNDNRWMLLDYGQVVAHIFIEGERQYYSLENLWADAEIISY